MVLSSPLLRMVASSWLRAAPAAAGGTGGGMSDCLWAYCLGEGERGGGGASKACAYGIKSRQNDPWMEISWRENGRLVGWSTF